MTPEYLVPRGDLPPLCGAVNTAWEPCRGPQLSNQGCRVWLLDYYCSLWYYWVKGGTYEGCPYFAHDPAARVQMWGLAVTTSLWDIPHYRSANFAVDSRKNLSNVALPRTPVTLDACYHSIIVWKSFILFVYPFLCFLTALLETNPRYGFTTAWRKAALYPDTWFNYWRLNCRLASYHHARTQSADYMLEDKWVFTEMCEDKGIPCAPCIALEGSRLIVKHRNEEGGLGLQTFKPCQKGGPWLIQEALDNREDIAAWLPSDAPLSTLRVVTKSSAAWDESDSCVKALSCVWRAGRSGAQTDHCSVLFDVDMSTGKIRKGTVNHDWYPSQRHKCTEQDASFTVHPDSGITLAGLEIPGIHDALALAERAHLALCPGALLVGWDVALTTKGSLLLEANLMCNFFQADFDRHMYFQFVKEAIQHLERTTEAPTPPQTKKCHSWKLLVAMLLSGCGSVVLVGRLLGWW